jgi:hypothetical protein
MSNEITAASHLTPEERLQVEQAVERGIAAYVASRQQKIAAFDERHFSFHGAFALHRKTFLKDIYKFLLNMLWSLPYFLAQTAALVAEKIGAQWLGRMLRKVPPGLKTAYQREINWLIQTELLELPYSDGTRTSTKDAMLESILADPELSARCAGYLAEIGQPGRTAEFRAALESRLVEYGKSRLAVSELAGNVINLAAGYALFQQATPGVISTGSALAAAVAQPLAIANFWLGPTLGAWYYGVFPATASMGLIAASTGALMAATGVLAALSLVVVEPLLAKTGFHRRRLERFVRALGEALTGTGKTRYQVKDHYLARVLDLVDLLKLAAKTAGRVS